MENLIADKIIELSDIFQQIKEMSADFKLNHGIFMEKITNIQEKMQEISNSMNDSCDQLDSINYHNKYLLTMASLRNWLR